MKKLSILFVTLITLGLSITSCSKDNNNSTSDDNTIASIEGKWETTHEGEIVDGKESLQPVESNGTCGKDYLEFLSNGTYKDISFDSDCSSRNEEGTWSIKDNKLTLKVNDIIINNDTEILILDSTTLKLKYTITEDGQPDEMYIEVLKKL